MKAALFVFVFFANVFYPTYVISSSVSDSQKVLFFFLSLAVLLALMVHVRGLVFRASPPLLVVLLSYSVLMLWSLFYFLCYAHHGLLNSLNAFRYLFYFLVFYWGFLLAGFVSLELMYRVLMVTLILQLVFMVFQYTLPESSWVLAFSQHHLTDFLGRRVGGTFNWTYIMGFFLVLCMAWNVGVFYKAEKSKADITWALFFLVMCYVGVLATQSRTALIAGMILTIYMVALSSKNPVKMFGGLLVIIPFVGVVLGGAATFLDTSYVAETLNFSALSGGVEGVRLAHRFDQLSLVSNMTPLEWVFGAEAAIDITVENAYGHYLFRHGVLGLAVYLVMLGLLYADTLKGVFRYRSAEDYPAVLMSHLAVVSVILFGVSSSPLDAHKLAFIIFIMLGWSCGIRGRKSSKGGSSFNTSGGWLRLSGT